MANRYEDKTQRLVSHNWSEEYKNNYDKIFGKKEEKVSNRFNTGNKERDYIQLLDTAYDIMEIWDTSESPYNQELRKEWLERAEQLGAYPSL